MKRAWLLLLVLGLLGLPASGCCAQPSAEESGRRVRLALPAYQDQLGEARGVFLGKPVRVLDTTRADLATRLREEREAGVPEPRRRAVARALARLGLLPPGFDLGAEADLLSAGQDLAHYHAASRSLLLVEPTAPDERLLPALVKQLAHALQDARFDLRRLARTAGGDDELDAATALRDLVEGEATYVMYVATLGRQGFPPALADMIVEAYASLGREQLIEKQPPGEPTERARRLPLYAFRALVEARTRGAALVAAAHRRGGWGAVDELFLHPPAATRDCLHPVPPAERVPPVGLTLPTLVLGQGWAALHESTLGELGVSCLLEERLGDGRERAAAGWAGDRFRAYDRGDRTAIAWLTTWEAEGPARAFEAAVGELARRDELRPGEASSVLRRGGDVAVVLGVPAAEAQRLLGELLERTTRSR